MRRVVGVLAVAVGALLIFLLGRQNQELRTRYDALREQLTVARPGYSVPMFEATTLDGAAVTVGRADSGRHQLLFVFAAECPFCQASVSSWNRLVQELAGSVGAAVTPLGLSQSPEPDTRRFVTERGFGAPVSLFPEDKLVRLYRAGSVPLIMLLDETGRVRYSRLGVLPPESTMAIDSVVTERLRAAAEEGSNRLNTPTTDAPEPAALDSEVEARGLPSPEGGL